jgi:hypothetical protein
MSKLQARYASHNGLLQFGHFETVKPGEILDFSLGKTFLFFCWPRSFVRCSDVQKWSHYMFRAVR